MKLMLTLMTGALVMFLSGCANDGTDASVNANVINPTGTPSPLNTSENAWNNVNVRNQQMYEQSRIRSGGGRGGR